ncbi:MAG: DUF5786 family protein [Halobacteriota archaeon]
MGFGSYDESEQERQEYDAEDLADAVSERAAASDHDGSVDFEIGASQDQLLDRLQEIKDDDGS